MTTYTVTLQDLTTVEVQASSEDQAFQTMAYLHMRDDITFLPTERELIMNLYTITFWTDPEDPEIQVEVQVGARTGEAALAEARLQHPELADCPSSVSLDWEGTK